MSYVLITARTYTEPDESKQAERGHSRSGLKQRALTFNSAHGVIV